MLLCVVVGRALVVVVVEDGIRRTTSVKGKYEAEQGVRCERHEEGTPTSVKGKYEAGQGDDEREKRTTRRREFYIT